MTPEEAAKSGIIERIVLELEPLGTDASIKRRKPDLKRLTIAELERLRQRLSGANDGQTAVSMFVEAITTSDAARRKAEDDENGGGSAKVEMTPQ